MDINQSLLRPGRFRLAKYEARYDAKRGIDIVALRPFEIIEFENAYVNAGGALALDLITGTGTAFSNANAAIGVGDSSTATTSGMTDLQAATNKLRKAMDATFPSRAGQVMTFKSTFATGDANYSWQEFAIFNNISTGTMLCRALQNTGTKTSAMVWVPSYTLTLP